MQERVYTVEVSHATGFHKGRHIITVKTNYSGASVYCSSPAFGCSRDYAATDSLAVRTFLAEHGCAIVRYWPNES
jgi:hypothetical protein